MKSETLFIVLLITAETTQDNTEAYMGLDTLATSNFCVKLLSHSVMEDQTRRAAMHAYAFRFYLNLQLS